MLAQADGQYFVAPDNGVLSMIFARGKKPIVRAITAERYFRKPVSATFHGRDVFAPVAAHLAKGVAAARFGPKIDNALRLTLPPVQRTGKRAWSGCVLHVDRFGNIITNFHRDDFAAAGSSPFAATIGMHAVTRLATNYGEAAFGEPVAIWGSAGYLEIVVNQGNAARMLGVGAGAPVDFGYL
ncbi:MAG: SAM-dependent chlorinase/fluorinase [Candidatus Solibacter usitatus]|nr:SAM-dependent chlorinase/fluorinase [Candidatus Solibacter usitatus]